MARQFQLPAQAEIPLALAPATDAAGRTSSYFAFKNAHKAYAVLLLAQGNAATVTFSVLQASDSSGTGSKAVAASPIWSNLDESVNDTLTSRTAATSYTTDAGTKNKVVVIEITPDAHLDMANSFNHIAVKTGASDVANITAAFIMFTPLRFQQAVVPVTNV